VTPLTLRLRLAYAGPMADDKPESLRRELELYRQLLDLGRQEEIAPFLEEAVSLIVKVAGARRGYLELRAERPGADDALFWIARGCSDEQVAEIRDAFSAGVIAEAIATGSTICVASALLDPRFRERRSVRKHRIEAVLCTPIGASPPLGVLYLQDRLEPGPFAQEHRLLAETFARTVAVFADRLLMRRRDEEDPTLRYRRTLRVAEGIVGRSAVLAKLFKQVAMAAPLDIGVLLTGPAGTGKTRVARLLHDNGPRAGGPFVALNCAALPETLFESELFGYEKGAFTGATRKSDGKVAAAEHGTLFLDEIGEIPLTSQAKLLTLLESKEYYPLGATRPVRADVRIVAATNADLKAAVKRRAFREDLYFRLDVMPLRVPALAERREDIADLVRHFCELAVEEHKLPRVVPSPGAFRAAEAAEWPGNVRELGHAVQRAVLTAASEGVLEVERQHLFPEDAPAGGTGEPRGKPPPTFQDATRAFQAEFVQRALDETGWNVMETAARLNLTRSHVYNLIKGFGLERGSGGGSAT
jgi:transcriptional regulator with GAF, ATPase, and Fis domain